MDFRQNWFLILLAAATILAALFIIGQKTGRVAVPTFDFQTRQLEEQTVSDEVSTIEADLEETELKDIDAELEQIDQELESLEGEMSR